MLLAGLKVPRFPPLKAEGPLQLPEADGEPPRIENKFTELPELQRVVLPLVPAETFGFTVKV